MGAVVPESCATEGLRGRKKEATRLALHRAAVALATENGLDRVTVEAIADAAQVSRRTFSNYFANKEEAILFGETRRLTRLVELVARRPPGEPAWTALSAAALEMIAERRNDPEWPRQLGLLRLHPALIARQVVTFGQAERTLAEVIVPRLPAGPDRELRARLLTATLLGTLRIAIQTSMAPDAPPLPEVLAVLLRRAAEPWT